MGRAHSLRGGRGAREAGHSKKGGRAAAREKVRGRQMQADAGKAGFVFLWAFGRVGCGVRERDAAEAPTQGTFVQKACKRTENGGQRPQWPATAHRNPSGKGAKEREGGSWREQRASEVG